MFFGSRPNGPVAGRSSSLQRAFSVASVRGADRQILPGNRARSQVDASGGGKTAAEHERVLMPSYATAAPPALMNCHTEGSRPVSKRPRRSWKKTPRLRARSGAFG